jgi:hypothetical protein
MNRNGFIHKFFLTIILAVMTVSLVSCGGDSNLYAVINNKKVTLPIAGVDVFTNGIIPQALPGANGISYAGASLTILITFVNGNITDRIIISVKDVGAILVGQTYYADGGNISASMTLSGQEQPLSQGSFVIVFSQIGALDGQTVAGSIQANSLAFINGNFSGSVHQGY